MPKARIHTHRHPPSHRTTPMPVLPRHSLRPLLAAALGLLAVATARAEDPAPDQASCITRGLEPASRVAGTANARLALRSCLVTATPSPGLCAGVPAPDGRKARLSDLHGR